MIIQIPERYSDQLTRKDLLRIISYLNLNPINIKIETTKKNGRAIVLETENRQIFVIFSAKKVEGRNTFITQYVATVLYQFITSKSTKNKEIYAYLLDTSSKAEVNYLQDTYRMLKTININILNEEELSNKIEEYTSVREWKNHRESRKKFNPANNSSYVIDNNDRYTIFGKAFGANGKESTLICSVIGKIAFFENKKVYLHQVEDNKSKQISQNDKVILEYYNVIIGEDVNASQIPKIPANEEFEKESSRNQTQFYYNLLVKYGSKKCYICENDIEETIIASHIHRIADIDKSQDSFQEKSKKAVDADNGFWLCANHDKMFENGLFYFKERKLIIANELLEAIKMMNEDLANKISKIDDVHLRNQLKDYVKINHNLLVLTDFEISIKHFNSNMNDFLKLHSKRVLGY